MTSAFMDFLKDRWWMIVMLVVISLAAILVLLFVAGLLLRPAEVTSSGRVVTYCGTSSAGWLMQTENMGGK